MCSLAQNARQAMLEWLCKVNEKIMRESKEMKLTDVSTSMGIPLSIKPIGEGQSSHCLLFEDVTAVFGPNPFGNPIGIVAKVCKMGKNICDVSDYEVIVGKEVTRLCLGGSSSQFCVSPHVIRVFGSMQTKFSSRPTKILLMEPLCPPSKDRSFEELLLSLRRHPRRWNEGWVRLILFQVLYTLSVIGPTIRHNDLSPSNVGLSRLTDHQMEKGFAYCLTLNAKDKLYFRVPKGLNMPFLPKLLDFGLAIDLSSGLEPRPFGLTPKGARALGIAKTPSRYFDVYFFLHTTLALASPFEHRSMKEVDDFLKFMERHSIATMPRVDEAVLKEIFKKDMPVRPWLPLDVQREAEDHDGKVRSAAHFDFQTASQLLQDPYFDPLRTDEATFASFGGETFMAPIQERKTNRVKAGACTIKGMEGKTLDGLSLYSDSSDVDSFSFPIM